MTFLQVPASMFHQPSDTWQNHRESNSEIFEHVFGFHLTFGRICRRRYGATFQAGFPQGDENHSTHNHCAAQNDPYVDRFSEENNTQKGRPDKL